MAKILARELEPFHPLFLEKPVLPHFLSGTIIAVDGGTEGLARCWNLHPIADPCKLTLW